MSARGLWGRGAADKVSTKMEICDCEPSNSLPELLHVVKLYPLYLCSSRTTETQNETPEMGVPSIAIKQTEFKLAGYF